MLQILGLGFASPKNNISDQLLLQLNPDLKRSHSKKETGLCSRHTALDLDYLAETSNSDLKLSLANLAESDLELAAQAVRHAVSKAGIQLEDIGLVIGETCTPFQTIPSQAQRVAGALGMRVKAYDILAGTASPALHLATLASWREERLPDYILLVYSNMPTVFIDYSSVTPSLARFSDTAAALIVSTRHKGTLSVISSNSNSHNSGASTEVIEIFKSLQISRETERIIDSQLEIVGQESLSKCPRGSGKNYFVSSQTSSDFIIPLAERLGFTGDEIMISAYGESFSSASFGPVFDQFDHLTSGDRIYMAFCGIGIQSGHIVLEVN